VKGGIASRCLRNIYKERDQVAVKHGGAFGVISFAVQMRPVAAPLRELCARSRSLAP
jgi:hypothetical protein